MRSVRFVEIDIPFCDLVYGNAPCTAAIGVTGDRECFNTRTTCQDLPNFDPSDVTLRFASPSADLDQSYDAIPSLASVQTTPAVIDPGLSLGLRESVIVTFDDHQSSDAGLDPYLDQRSYDPFTQGTFWGKFRARNRSLKGRALRVLYGEDGDDLADMVTYNYVIEDTVGPRSNSFQIVAKDALKLIDGDRAQAPAISNGELAADIDDTVTSIGLSPAGIGDLEYPASGLVAIGSTEIVSFTRAADTLTVVRGQSNTDASDHDEGEIVQIVLQYDSESPADIIYDLMTTYSNIPASWIPLADWQEEVSTWIGRLYTADIAEPTPVRDLVNELISQVGLIVWWDPIGQMVRLTALRPVSSSATVYDTGRIIAGSYSSKEQPKKRISQPWTYFNLINPLEPLDESQNYQGAVATIDPDDTEADYDDQPAIAKNFSRWIDFGNRPAASRLNDLLLARYQIPPRMFTFSIYRTDERPQLGRGARLSHWDIQDDTGAEVTTPVQITSVETTEDRYNCMAEEMLFTLDLDGDQSIIIDDDSFNLNLRELYDQFYTGISVYRPIVFFIETGVRVGCSGQGGAARSIDVGDWPDGAPLFLVIDGDVLGSGGTGGQEYANANGTNGVAGGTAIYTRVPITITNNGNIRGGGGGGGGCRSAILSNDGASGGGGAGFVPGVAGTIASAPGSPNQDFRMGADGTELAGGAGGDDIDSPAIGGDGGDPGEAGEDAVGGVNINGSGGAAGNAIDGDSFVTFALEGTIVGPRVN